MAVISAFEVLGAPLRDARTLKQIRGLLAASGRVHVPDCLTLPTAQALYEACGALDWSLMSNNAHASGDSAAKDLSALEVGQSAAMLDAVNVSDTTSFDYLYDAYRISDAAEDGMLASGPIGDVFAALNGEAMLELFRTMTGDNRIQYLDAEATRFRSGHFRAAHEDNQPEMNRLYAYAINLTPVWRADFGGLHMVLGDHGHIAEAYTPRWNTLIILQASQIHGVSVVAPFARGVRYSITGWMRARKPE